MKKRIILTMLATVAAVSLMGCGITTTTTYTETTTDADGNTTTTTTTTTNGETTTETTEEVAEAQEVTSPFQADLEKYDSIISTLTSDQYYAFAGVGEDYDVLLVTDGVYDFGDGTMAAIDAKVYGIDSNGKIYESGSVWSNGTAYPIAVYEDVLMFGGNHSMAMANVIDASVIIQREAYEEFDEQGNATYYLNEGNIDDIKILDDDSALKEMYEAYAEAVVINFFQAGVN